MFEIILVLLSIATMGLLVGASVVRGHIEEVKFSTDYAGDVAAATWVTIPVLKIQSEGLQKATEEAQLVQTMNSHDASAGKKLVGIYPVAYADDDTFLSALETAEDELDGVWFYEQPTDQKPRVIGGDNGCTVYVNRNPSPAFGSLVSALIGFSVTGPTPGSTYRVLASVDS